MTTHFTSLPAAGTRFSRVLSCGLFAALTAATAHGVCVQQRSYLSNLHQHPCAPVEARPLLYLPTVGAVALRFAPPPPVATERPPRPQPAAAIVDTGAQATASINANASSQPPTAQDGTETTLSHSANTPAVATPDLPETSSGEKPVRILPDDTPRDIRAEDVLPYFQFSKDPDSGADVSVPFTPASPSQPPSSATYQLK